VGDKITLDVLKDIEIVTLKGITKGKGFQWVVKRFGFAGGPASHGSKFHRHPWSIGNRKPRRVNKNHPLPGHMWAQNITLKNVKIIATHKLDDDNIVVVKWSVPWSRNSLIRVYL
jgi:large subunit ribosomal protein L3